MTKEEILEGLCYIKNWKCQGDAGMYNIIAEAINYLKTNHQYGEWVFVEEDLPKGLMTKVLVSAIDKNNLPVVPYVAVYDRISRKWETENKVLKWMPLPE